MLLFFSKGLLNELSLLATRKPVKLSFIEHLSNKFYSLKNQFITLKQRAAPRQDRQNSVTDCFGGINKLRLLISADHQSCSCALAN